MSSAAQRRAIASDRFDAALERYNTALADLAQQAAVLERWYGGRVELQDGDDSGLVPDEYIPFLHRKDQ